MLNVLLLCFQTRRIVLFIITLFCLNHDLAFCSTRDSDTQDINIHNISPTMQEFLDKGALVHLGSLCFDEDASEVYVKGYQPLTYWSLNAPCPHQSFLRKIIFNPLGCVVISPLRNCVDSLVSVCAQEVMYLGDYRLREGDIVFVKENSWIDVYNQRLESTYQRSVAAAQKEYEDNIAKQKTLLEDLQKEQGETFDITPFSDGYAAIYLDQLNRRIQEAKDNYENLKGSSTFKEGTKVLYSVEEKLLLNQKRVEVRSVLPEELNPTEEGKFGVLVKSMIQDALVENGYWVCQFEQGFWTHKTPFTVDGKRVMNQRLFFQSLLELNPRISFGYEFVSLNGYASLFRIASSLEENVGLYYANPALYRTLFHFIKDELNKYMKGYDTIDESRRIESVRKLEKMKTTLETEESVSNIITDDQILKVVLPMSPEVFNAASAYLESKVELPSFWPNIKAAYEFACHHRQFNPDFSRLNGERIYHILSPDARELVFIEATGHDFISGDGRELPGSPNIKPNMSEEEIQNYEIERRAYFREWVSNWFLSLPGKQ